MKALKWLEKIEEYAAYTFFLVAILISLYQVFMRYVLNKPPVGVLEIIEILMPWAIFIGFGRALKEGHHIAVDVVYDRLPFQLKRVFAVIGNLCGAGFSLLLVVTGLQMVLVAMDNGFVTNTNSIPLWIEYSLLPIAMALLCIYFLFKTYKAIKGNRAEIEGFINQEEYEKYISDDKGGKKE